MKNKKEKPWRLSHSFQSGLFWAVLLFAGSILHTLLEVSFSEELGNSLDVAATGNREVFYDYLVKIVVLVAVFLIVRIFYSMVENRYLKKVLYAMRAKAFQSIAEKRYGKFCEYAVADWKSFMVNDMQLLENSYIIPMVHTMTDGVTLFITLWALFQINVTATVFVVFASCVPLLLSRYLIIPVQKKFGEYSSYMGIYTLYLNDYLDGVEEFVDYHAQEAVQNLHAQKADMLEQKKKRAYLQLDFMSNAIAISSIAVTIGILLVGMFLALNGMLTVGQVFAISFISNGVSTPLSNLSDYIPKILSVKEIVKKYNTLVYPEIRKPPLKALNDGINVENISLILGEKAVLDQVSYLFSLGKKYVLVGESGSGKSTLLKLMMGYFDNYEGKLSYGDVDLRTVNSDSLYGYIAYVPQKGIVIDAAVRDNFTVFDKQTSDKTVQEMITKIGLRKRIEEFGITLDDLLTEDENVLSGGEQQRLSLGRALLQEKDILFLDEATSALDHASYLEVEKKILESKSSTIISVQHRLQKTVLEQYDMILAMRNGKIIESGNWCQLIEKKGYFYELIQAQMVDKSSCEK